MLKYLKRLTDKNDVICLQETHGKDEILTSSSGTTHSISDVWCFCYIECKRWRIGNLHSKKFLPDRAEAAHGNFCHGLDQLVRIQSGDSKLVVINVRFEPDLTLRNLRERLRRIAFHWPRYPEGFGVNFGDFNICDPEQGRFRVGSQTFTEGDPGKTALFRTFFPARP